ncbi:adenosylcobinamide-GDP ribazoletransferase [Synechococcus sp. CBW1002]|nr:adenosylcobinamide-GDP ribazoletransferase [Synechococcus sp. CBW1002]
MPPPGPSPAHPLAPNPDGRDGWLADLAGAWIFYSVLPAWPWPRPRFGRIARFAPWIGLVLGGLQALAWLLLVGRAPALTQAALVIVLGLALSGGLHSDGAMDTADGLAAGDRCHEAMADSRVGASGVQAFAQLLLVRLAALVWLAAAAAAAAPAALVWAAFWGRLSPLIAMDRFPYRSARGTGAFHRHHWRGLALELRPSLLVLAGVVLLVPATGAAGFSPGAAPHLWLPLLAGAVGVLPAVLVPLWLGRRLGSHSGDSYGACVEWVEALSLLLTAALVALLPLQAG